MKRIVESNGKVVYVEPSSVTLLVDRKEGGTYLWTNTEEPFIIDAPIDDLAKQLGFIQSVPIPAGYVPITPTGPLWQCPSCRSAISNKDYQDRAHLDGPYADTLNTCAVCHTPLAQFKEIK